jgi:ubiquinone/menaquinone biosynthesis C-methylase UbiE
MNFVSGLINNVEIHTTIEPLEDIITPEYFIQVICILKNLQSFYNFNVEKWDDIIYLKNTYDQSLNNRIVISNSSGFIKFKENKNNIYPLLHIKPNETNSIYGLNKNLNYDGLVLVFMTLFTTLVQKFKSNKRYKSLYFEPICSSLGENISYLIYNNKIEYLNVDTLPTFSELFEQSITVFDEFLIVFESPPIQFNRVDSKDENVEKKIQNEITVEKIEYCNTILPSLLYLIDEIKGQYSIYKFPILNILKDLIYPSKGIENEKKNEIKSIFLYWLLKGNELNFNLESFYKFKKFENQTIMHSLFENFQQNLQKNSYPYTYTLSQVKNVKNKNDLIELVGKFLYGKNRNMNENKILMDLIKKFGKENDITFYYEVSKFYKPSYDFDRSQARVKDLLKCNIVDFLGEINDSTFKYLDFGGGDGQNAYAISTKVLNIEKKGNIFVSDIQSWFGNENVQKYKDILTYRYLKSFYLPFENETFDFITCFQVLHHIRKVELTLKELYRILKKGAILLIREHECDNEQTSLLIDIEHSLFEISGKINVDYSYLEHYFAHYFTKEELYNLLIETGFKLVLKKNGQPLETEPIGITRYYISVWQK